MKIVSKNLSEKVSQKLHEKVSKNLSKTLLKWSLITVNFLPYSQTCEQKSDKESQNMAFSAGDHYPEVDLFL